MPSLVGVVERCAELWGAVILQAARDARKATLVVPKKPRPGERMRPFFIRKRKAEVDKLLGGMAPDELKALPENKNSENKE